MGHKALRGRPIGSPFGHDSIAKRIGKSLPTVKRAMKCLSDSGAVRRVGGKRFGKWEINPKA